MENYRLADLHASQLFGVVLHNLVASELGKKKQK